MRIRLRGQGVLGIRDGDLWRPAWGRCAQQQQTQGRAPEGQGVLAVGLGVDRGIPSPAIRFEFGDNDRALFADMMDRLSVIYDKAGVEMDRFADSTGKIQELAGEPLAL